MTIKKSPSININKMRNKVVVKSNDFIQASEYKISYNQYKVIKYCFATLADKEQPYVDINIKEYCQAIGLTLQSNNFSGIREALSTMVGAPFRVESEQISINEAIIDSVDFPSKNEARIRISDSYTPLVHYVEPPYTQYKFINIAFLTSYYSIRLYEMCKSWQVKKSFTIEVDKLRKQFGVEESLNCWQHFKERALLKPIQEINQLTDINVEMYYINRLRTVNQIEFHISSKTREERAKVKQYIEKYIDSKY
ncbi:replication initiation protein [Vibrio porteresiae]|uniref:Replication initiation protein n=1 Tax=Vibrio porteresiae DSM 19223 TaxID=1123496 RepID=A0ABZ0QG12_9VIBR|nr:replication initiation protein [Vibrio porteresiae]WPC74431.1 replication initiation protein [Vibrio porteresiae DSM 19223]